MPNENRSRETMSAWVTGESTVLARSELPLPQANRDEVIIQVRAAALNNGDLTASGEDHIAGFEFMGDVTSVGDGVDSPLVGERVLGITGGALAEYAVAHKRHVIRVPESLSDAEAAATATAFTTEYGAVSTASVLPGATVLVTAGSSSLGLVAIQVASELGAAQVLATTRSADKVAALEAVGAKALLVTDEDSIRREVHAETDGRGVDVVLDHIGGSALDSVIASAKDGGTVISVGRLGGGTGTVDLFALARRHVLLRSVSYGLTPPEVLGELFDGLAEALVPGLQARRIRPIVGATFGFDRADEALEALRAGRTAGKIVVTIP